MSLDNDLPVSVVQVALKPRFGFFYHPGAALVLDGQVRVAGAGFDGGVTVQEGDPERGPRYEKRQTFEARGLVAFQLPIRAPKGGAALTLSVWKDAGEGSRQEVFRSSPASRVSLASLFCVVPDQDRNVLQAGPSLFQAPAHWHVAKITRDQMPEEDWMYENVDLVVLGSEEFPASSVAAKETLRRWVLGGGRLLVASLDALKSAILAGLLPLPREHKDLDGEALVTKAGLTEGDVQRDERGSRVFVQFRLGLGGGVFFFSGVDPATLAKYGFKALQSAGLVPERSRRLEARIWERPFTCFAPGAIAGERRRKAFFYAAVGAAALVALLLYARKERLLVLAAGLPLAGAAFLAALLAHAFPAPEWVASRLELSEVSADGRAVRRTEWTYLEGPGELSKLTARGPEAGTFLTVHANEAELSEAGTGLEDDGALRERFRPLFPAPLPPLFQATRCEAQDDPEGSAGEVLGLSTGRHRIHLPPGPWRARLKEAFGRMPRGAVLVGSDGRRFILRAPFANPAGEMRTASFEGPKTAVQEALSNRTGEASTVRAAALELALDRGEDPAQARLALFDDAPEQRGVEEEALTRIEGARVEEGPVFRIWIFQVKVEGTPANF